MRKDSLFLESQGLMDYSLLLAIEQRSSFAKIYNDNRMAGMLPRRETPQNLNRFSINQT